MTSDFGHLLSKIHHTPPISHQYLILLRPTSFDPNLTNTVDEVIQLDPQREPHCNIEEQKCDETHSQIHVEPNGFGYDRDCITLHLQDLNSDEIITVNVHKPYSVCSLRESLLIELLNTERAVKRERIALFQGGVRLKFNGDRQLSSYGIVDGDTLIWYTEDLNSYSFDQHPGGVAVPSTTLTRARLAEHDQAALNFAVSKFNPFGFNQSDTESSSTALSGIDECIESEYDQDDCNPFEVSWTKGQYTRFSGRHLNVSDAVDIEIVLDLLRQF